MQLAGISEQDQIEILREAMQVMADSDPLLSPSEISNRTHQIIRERTGGKDIYLDIKQADTKLAMQYLDDLRKLAGEGKDQLEQAVKIAASGNIMDIVHVKDYNLWVEVEKTLSQPLLGDSLDDFRNLLGDVDHLLYLADNSGETVFDRVLIESLDIPVIYAVKGGPIFNDATYQEAVAAGIDQVAEIIETGSSGPGTILTECSPEFLEVFKIAPLVLAKGQANYETVDECGDKVFNLLRIKCPIIGREIGYPVGSLVMKRAAKKDE
jgi:uncharacterized protein with ATP-grasp and redox domains